MKRASLEAMDLTLGESFLALVLAVLPSPLKVLVYRLAGAHIGKKVEIGFGTVIMAEKFSSIRIGDYTVIRNFNIIICREVDIGKYVHIAMFVWIWGSGKLKLGNKCIFGARLRLDLRRNNLSCGEFVGIGTGVIIYTHTRLWEYTRGWGYILKDVTLEDRVLIGMNSVILPGMRVGTGSIVGAGSVVTKSVPPGSFVAGSPARVISSTDKFRKKIDSRELKERIVEIAEDLLDYKNYELVLKKKCGGSHIMVFRKSGFMLKKKMGLVVSEALAPCKGNLKNILNSNGVKARNVILFSASRVPSDVSHQYPLWFDLKNMECSFLETAFAREIWHFLYYAWNEICDVQPKVQPGKNNKTKQK